MNSENDNNNKCWNITDNIINNTDCIYKICKKIIWFWKKSELKLNECWGNAVNCDYNKIF